MTEWRPVVGYEGKYLVSNEGFMWTLARGHVINLELSDSGHLTVQLWKHNQKRRRQVHNLVLEAFVGPRPDGLEGCHNDGDPFNNHVSNLRWDTAEANRQDAIRHKKLKESVA